MRVATATIGLLSILFSFGQSDAANVGCTYDKLNRLVRVDYYEKGVEFTYEYDANGNRTASAVTELTDSDGDGLSDRFEAFLGTDPNDSDTDGDLMPDGWEVGYGLSPLVDDANEDPDGDGYTNLTEYLNGTDPTNRISPHNGAMGFLGGIQLLLMDENEAGE